MRVTIDIPDDLAGKLEAERKNLSEIIERELRQPSSEGLTAVQEVFDFLARKPRPEEIIAFRLSERSEERVRELLEKNRESSLTDEEEAEMDTTQTLNHLFSLIKIQARQQLRTNS